MPFGDGTGPWWFNGQRWFCWARGRFIRRNFIPFGFGPWWYRAYFNAEPSMQPIYPDSSTNVDNAQELKALREELKIIEMEKQQIINRINQLEKLLKGEPTQDNQESKKSDNS